MPEKFIAAHGFDEDEIDKDVERLLDMGYEVADHPNPRTDPRTKKMEVVVLMEYFGANNSREKFDTVDKFNRAYDEQGRIVVESEVTYAQPI